MCNFLLIFNVSAALMSSRAAALPGWFLNGLEAFKYGSTFSGFICHRIWGYFFGVYFSTQIRGFSVSTLGLSMHVYTGVHYVLENAILEFRFLFSEYGAAF